jgi:hypothetical protein
MRTTDDALVAMLDELVVLSAPATHERAVALLGRLGAGDLRVALVGEAKRGKSTLGNAMLGHDILPTGVVPVTALSTEVQSGSPARAEISFAGGNVRTVEISEIEQFVSERHNPANHKRVEGVRVFLPEGMPHPRMVLVDTPGVGSVHRHNTDEANEAFTTMDAAVFVLTADPPLSATELALLGDVADKAVRVFVVLNKADQLSESELPEAVEFVTDVVAGALGTQPDLWVCSARQGLRGRAADDERGWQDSGVPAFLDALVGHLVEHREQDLRLSIATAAGRLAVQQLDGVRLTLAAAEALDTEQEDRVREFRRRLDQVDRRRDEAVGFIAADLKRQRLALDTDAEAEVARITGVAKERLEAFLGQPPDGAAAELEENGRGVIAEATQSSVETWRSRWEKQLDEALSELAELQQRLLTQAAGDLHAAAQELLGVQLQGEVPVLSLPQMPRLRYDFNPDIGWNEALVTGLRTHAPARMARRRVANYLRSESGRLVDKHVGRARADFQARLEEAGRRLTAHVVDAFNELTEGLRAGHQAALDLRQRADQSQGQELKRLQQERLALDNLVRSLAEVRDSSGPARSPLGVPVSSATTATQPEEET